MRVLFVSPLVPAVGGSGGRRVAMNHLQALLAAGHEVDLVAFDIEGTGDRVELEAPNLRTETIPRRLGRPDRDPRAAIAAVWQLLTDMRPRIVSLVTTRDALRAVRTRLAGRAHDVLVFEHLMAGDLARLGEGRLPVVYIEQNIEADVAHDLFVNARWHSPVKLPAWLDWHKTVAYEATLLERVDGIVAISRSDAAHPRLAAHADKLVLVEEVPAVQALRWAAPASRRLLFVGSCRYFPNRDAIEWLVRVLVPHLRSRGLAWRLDVAGSTAAEAGFGDGAPGVAFHGFLDATALTRLHLDCDAFICPVVLGSGVKVKLLEAAAHGMPLLATPESVAGSSLLARVAHVFHRDDPTEVARALEHFDARPANLAEAGAAVTRAVEAFRADAMTLPRAVDLLVGRAAQRTRSGSNPRPNVSS